jgi:hypothetical protein
LSGADANTLMDIDDHPNARQIIASKYRWQLAGSSGVDNLFSAQTPSAIGLRGNNQVIFKHAGHIALQQYFYTRFCLNRSQQSFTVATFIWTPIE